MIHALGIPGDIVLIEKIPADANIYLARANLLVHNYHAMGIAPTNPMTGVHAT